MVVSVKNLSVAAEHPRVRVGTARVRLAMLAAAILIPVCAVALALTFRSANGGAPLAVQAQKGPYRAAVGTGLSVTAFRIANTSRSVITISRVLVAKDHPDVSVIGALAYRGCVRCVASTAVPPTVAAPRGVSAPPLLPVGSFTLKPGEVLTLVLSVTVSSRANVQVPPLRIDTTGPAGSRTTTTGSGPELCTLASC